MRNGLYTCYKGHHLSLNTIRDDDKNILVIFNGPANPSPNFAKSHFQKDCFEKIVKLSALTNAYSVSTFGRLNGFNLRVFCADNAPEGTVWIATSDKEVYDQLQLREVNTNWYMKSMYLSELEEIWEERSPTLGLPMPEGLAEKEYIKRSVV